METSLVVLLVVALVLLVGGAGYGSFRAYAAKRRRARLAQAALAAQAFANGLTGGLGLGAVAMIAAEAAGQAISTWVARRREVKRASMAQEQEQRRQGRAQLKEDIGNAVRAGMAQVSRALDALAQRANAPATASNGAGDPFCPCGRRKEEAHRDLCARCAAAQNALRGRRLNSE
jgi:hypothetical protein